MKNSRLIKWVGAAVLAIPLALGIAHADARNNVLAIGVPVEPVTLDPANGFTGFDYPFLYSLYDRLIDFEPKTLKLRPGLATAWRFIGNDQRAFEISLRPNVKFHDNTPLDAEAVKASLLRFKEIGLIRDLDPVVSIDVIDPLKLVLRLSSSYSVLPAILADRAGMIVSPTAVKASGKGYQRSPVGAGPFKLGQWTPGSMLELTAFPGYWDKEKIKLSGIQYKIIGNPTSLVSALLSGQIDHASNVDPKNVSVLKASDRVRVQSEPTLWVYIFLVNTGMPPLNDPKVRRAVSLSIDRKAISDAILGKDIGEGPATLLVPPSNWAHTSAIGQRSPYDPVQAKKLLAEAGYPDGISLKVCGTPVLGYGPEIVAIEQEQMKAAGIRIEATMLAGSACQQAWQSRNEYHLRQGGWSGRPDPWMTYQQIFASNGEYNRTKQKFPGVDEMLNDLLSAYSQEDQKKLYDKLNAVWVEQFPWIPLFYGSNVAVYAQNVAGEQPNLQGKLNPVTMYFKK